MTVVNHAAAGDHQGMIKFKNWKKGLYIDESSMFKKKLTFINKETVESYEVVMNDSGSSKKGALTKGVLGGAVFGLGGAIAGGTSSKKPVKIHGLHHLQGRDEGPVRTRRTYLRSPAQADVLTIEKASPMIRGWLFIVQILPSARQPGTSLYPCPSEAGHKASVLHPAYRSFPAQSSMPPSP